MAWPPHTEQELLDAAEAGTLNEAYQRAEFKREFQSNPRANQKIAIELASLAVEGGHLVIGIADEKNVQNPPDLLTPVDVTGMVERIENICSMRIDPVVQVYTWTFPSMRKPGFGYLVVEVNASPVAPHMVDGKYRGRNGTTNVVLSDGDVRRIIEQRRRSQEDVLRVVHTFSNRATRSHFGDTFTVPAPGLTVLGAVPLVGRRGMALTSWEGQPQSWAHQRVEEVRASWDPNRLGQLRGVIQSSYFLPSAEGFAIAYGAGTMPELVEFTEDGAVLSAGNIIADQELLLRKLLIDVGTFVRLAGRAGAAMNYAGQWVLTVRCSRLLGARPTEIEGADGSRFPGASYEEVCQATTRELLNSPGGVVSQLLGRFFRAMADDYDHLTREPFAD